MTARNLSRNTTKPECLKIALTRPKPSYLKSTISYDSMGLFGTVLMIVDVPSHQPRAGARAGRKVFGRINSPPPYALKLYAMGAKRVI